MLLLVVGSCSTSTQSEHNDNLYPIQDTTGEHFGFINKKGEKIVSPTFDQVRGFSEGLCAVREGEKWGFIDTKGEMVINPQFDQCEDFHEGMCAVGFGEEWLSLTPEEKSLHPKWGYINKKGELVIPPIYDGGGNFSEGLACVCNDDGRFFINKEGGVSVGGDIITCYEEFSNGLARFDYYYDGTRYQGYRNKKGDTVIEPKFSNVDGFWSTTLAIACCDGFRHAGVIDINGNWVIKPVASRGFFDIKIVNEDLIAIKKEDKWGIVNRNKEVVVNFIFDEFGGWRGANSIPIPVKIGQKWGYIDLNGKFVINPIYKHAKPFVGDLAKVTFEENEHTRKIGYINRDGRTVYKENIMK